MNFINNSDDDENNNYCAPNSDNAVLQRWLRQKLDQDIDSRLSLVQKSLRHYKYNVYLLNSKALQI